MPILCRWLHLAEKAYESEDYHCLDNLGMENRLYLIAQELQSSDALETLVSHNPNLDSGIHKSEVYVVGLIVIFNRYSELQSRITKVLAVRH